MSISPELKIIFFVLASAAIGWLSRSSLSDFHKHGFYRFFAWETNLILFLLNMDDWFADPFSIIHIISWLLLFISLYLVLESVRLFRQQGKIDPKRSDISLVGIEKTTKLVNSGIYRYIRHPMYSSLLFLGWGILFKNVTWPALLLALLNTVLLILTARFEERENIQFFGDSYRTYMKQTRMFIPFIF